LRLINYAHEVIAVKEEDEEVRKPGMSVIELLVVIAIIAILAAILFPVFARARAKAWQTNCLANLEQLGQALSVYEERGDVFPGERVEKVLYSRDFGGTLCAGALDNPEGRSYLWNRDLRGKPICRVLDCGKTIAAVDGYGHDEFFLRVEDGVAFRHNEGVNALFLDGHAKWLSRGSFLAESYFSRSGNLLPPVLVGVKNAEAGTYPLEGLADWSVAIDKDGNSRLVPRE